MFQQNSESSLLTGTQEFFSIAALVCVAACLLVYLFLMVGTEGEKFLSAQCQTDSYICTFCSHRHLQWLGVGLENENSLCKAVFAITGWYGRTLYHRHSSVCPSAKPLDPCSMFSLWIVLVTTRMLLISKLRQASVQDWKIQNKRNLFSII